MVCGYPPKRNEKKMTKEEILTMEPGRELDALVAEKVMGYNSVVKTVLYGLRPDYCGIKPSGNRISKIPNYSKDISSAWEVEEKIIEEGYNANAIVYYTIRLQEILELPFDKPFQSYEIIKIAHATPEQRCKAALICKAVL